MPAKLYDWRNAHARRHQHKNVIEIMAMEEAAKMPLPVLCRQRQIYNHKIPAECKCVYAAAYVALLWQWQLSKSSKESNAANFAAVSRRRSCR